MAVVAILGTLVYQTASASVPGLGTVLGGAAADGDGALPEGATVADVEHAGIANLDPALLQALGDATADAAADGIRLQVNSGWRSAQRQDQLLQDAIDEHGSEAEAARWVATADTSPHVSGDAVDVGPAEAATWLSVHGAAHGLCRIYDNEPWHFELRPDAVGTGCPATYADPTQDPRMQP
jgi:D-alanyl-D-alanine dipeptidase